MMFYRRAEPISPDDDNDLSEPTRALWVGTGGDVKVHMCGSPAGAYHTFLNVADGAELRIEIDRLLDAGGSQASDIMALRTGDPIGVAALSIAGSPATTATRNSAYAGFTPTTLGGLK